VGVCVFVRTHAHTLHMGYSDLSPRVGTRQLGGPKNRDGLNLGMNVFVHVYKVHVCIYMREGGMRSCCLKIVGIVKYASTFTERSLGSQIMGVHSKIQNQLREL